MQSSPASLPGICPACPASGLWPTAGSSSVRDPGELHGPPGPYTWGCPFSHFLPSSPRRLGLGGEPQGLLCPLAWHVQGHRSPSPGSRVRVLQGCPPAHWEQAPKGDSDVLAWGRASSGQAQRGRQQMPPHGGGCFIIHLLVSAPPPLPGTLPES